MIALVLSYVGVALCGCFIGIAIARWAVKPHIDGLRAALADCIRRQNQDWRIIELGTSDSDGKDKPYEGVLLESGA